MWMPHQVIKYARAYNFIRNMSGFDYVCTSVYVFVYLDVYVYVFVYIRLCPGHENKLGFGKVIKNRTKACVSILSAG